MARPVKQNLDYFPLDCVMDDSIEYIESVYGLAGYAIIIKLYQKIYGSEGFYCKWDTKNRYLFAKKIGTDMGTLNSVIELACDEGIFDQDMLAKYGILTSRGIQKRYFEYISRRTSTFSEEEKRYIYYENVNGNTLEKGEKTVNVAETPVNVAETPVNVDKNSTKERKEKESKKKTGTNVPAKEKAALFDDPELQKAFEEFIEFRKQIKAPLTDHAKELCAKKLRTLAQDINGDIDAVKAKAIIDQSVMNGWKGLFGLDDRKRHEPRAPAKNKFNDFPQRTYDFNDLERQLFERMHGG